MKDPITAAYIHILNEAYNKNIVKLYDVMAAIDDVTGNFRLACEKKVMREPLQRSLERIKNSVISVDAKEAEHKLNIVKSFYEQHPDYLEDALKPILLTDIKNADVDEYYLGQLAFAIWRAMKETKTQELKLNEKFKVGDKVSLVLTAVDFGEVTYKRNYRAFGNDTEYATCESDDYPDVDFRFPINDKMPHFKLHDIIKISGTVGNVSSTNVQVNLKHVKIEEILGEGGKEHRSSDKRTFTENIIHIEHSPTKLLEMFNSIGQFSNYAKDDFFDIIVNGFWEASSKEDFMNKFDSFTNNNEAAKTLRDDVAAYYDELKAIPEEKIPSTDNWYEFIK